MKDALETPWYYNRKNRPAWFSAEITSYCHYGDIQYVGQTMRLITTMSTHGTASARRPPSPA